VDEQSRRGVAGHVLPHVDDGQPEPGHGQVGYVGIDLDGEVRRVRQVRLRVDEYELGSLDGDQVRYPPPVRFRLPGDERLPNVLPGFALEQALAPGVHDPAVGLQLLRHFKLVALAKMQADGAGHGVITTRSR
jgi:hypothetical protein